jgi:hypothetical protein
MSLPPRPSQSSPAGEPTFVRQLRQWGAGIHDNLAQLQPGFRGQQFPSGSVPFRPPLMWPPHKVVQYDDLVVQVGPSRAMGVRAPDELVIISYRGALITVTLSTVENVTVTGSGYIYYEVTCTAGVWDAEAKYIAALSSLTSAGIIYVPIAKITVTSSVISRIEQLLHDNPTVQIGSPQYSITVDPQNGRLQFLADLAVPGPGMYYGTHVVTGAKGWWPLCPAVSSCAGEDPDDALPCGPCADAPNCLQVDDFTADMLDPTGCGYLGQAGTAWNGKLAKVSGAAEPCLYAGTMILTDPNDDSEYLAQYTLAQYLDDETCTWLLTFSTYGFGDGDSIIWQGTQTGSDPNATYSRVAGCDTTATIALTLCLRTIRVTISGMVRCCSSSAYKPDSVAMLNGTWDIVEDAPGAGTWTLAFGAFESWNLETYDGAACTGNITGSVAQDLNMQVTYDEDATWHINGANDGFGSNFWIFGTDTGGDETGGTCVGIYACGDVGDTILAAGGTATIEVL